MNVKVNLDYTIYDGAEIVFKAPCDASEVTGLIVYYPNGTEVVSSVFAFADAHTNDLGDIDNLFVAGAVVKVILDTETNMAFVQNAATNAYLEGRFAGIGGGGGESSKDVYVVRCAFDRDDNPYIIGEFDWGSMENAYRDGCPVFLQISNAVELDGTYPSDSTVAMYPIYFLDFADGIAFFRHETAIEKETFTIYNSGRITSTFESNIDDTLTKKMPANAKAVGDAIGDISSALDELHAYAEALKGGGAV